MARPQVGNRYAIKPDTPTFGESLLSRQRFSYEGACAETGAEPCDARPTLARSVRRAVAALSKLVHDRV